MIAELPPRGQWQRALTALPAARVQSVANDLGSALEIRHRALPQAGLAMLTISEPNRGDHFHLGELPVARAEVEIRTAEDQPWHAGGAQVLVDDEALATACAVCDGVLAAQLPGWESVAALVTDGAQLVADEARIRAGLLHSTTVDFDLLEAEDDDE